MYKCKKCNKIFSRKTNLENHTYKLFSCKAVEETEKNIVKISENITKNEENINNQCLSCNKIFSTKYNLNKHIKGHCKVNKNLNNLVYNKNILDKLKELLVEHNQNNNITNNNITNNITNNIQVNIFSAGNEDISRLTKEDILKICTSGTYYPIVAAELIHCNKNYPEFQNFLISNLRSNTGLVFINNNWVSKSQDEILTNIMQIDKKHVSNLIKDLQVDDKLQVKLESTKEEIVNNECKEHQKPKIKSRLYNASKMIIKNKKSTEKLLDE
jgi:hypothetical protein